MTTLSTNAHRPKVYITRQIPQKGLDMLLGRCNVSLWDSPDPAPRTELLVNIPGCNVLVCMPTDKVDREILNAAGSSLKIVATMSEDSDHIESSECTRRNIRILMLPKVTIDTLTHMAIALLKVITVNWVKDSSSNVNVLIQSKDVIQATKEDPAYCLELSNRTVGIVGLGALGLSVGKTLRDMGVSSILYHDTAPVAEANDIDAHFSDIDSLLAASDIIYVCSTLESNGKKSCFFDKYAFKKMKSSAILMDVTKRFFVNFTDLYEALRTGEIAAVGLDVREYDVIPNRHPLGVLENCFFLPYRECYKWDGRRKCSGELATSILVALQEIEFTQVAPAPAQTATKRGLVKDHVPKMNIPIPS